MLTKITFSLKYFSHIDQKIIKYLLQIIISWDFIVLGLISSLLKKLYNYSVIYDRFWERTRTKRISYRSVLYMWHIVKVEIGFENGLAQKYFFIWLTVTEFLYVYSPNTFYSSTWPHTIILMLMSLIGR
jgi:hypothetical protein